MKPKDKTLTYEQAKELKWFTKNCTGLRSEFYQLFDKMIDFKDKLDRLEKTSILINEYFKTHPELDPDRIFMKKDLKL